ncbi:nuclear transport factor 2 family protein [Tunturiibacter gelidiferens]|uniref:nuclear transport factor 2 family protein n=1 Tax=Tunturiibacter gelidiferens TaxID=3069689 RepID=UPI003D9B5C57
MRLLLLVTASLLASRALAQTPSAPSPLPAPVDIVKLEQNLWTTMAEGDFASVHSLFTPDFIQVDEHIQALDTLLITLKHCKLEFYELRDLQVRILSPDSALTAYHVVNAFNCGTADKPSLMNNDNNSVTVWVRQPKNGRWLAQVHTETPAKP